MLALLNLSPVEVAIIAIAAIVVFGRRLPQVAGQAAGAVQRLRRSLDDLRRETGIDREILEAKRAVESAVPREVRSLDVRRLARAAEAQIKASTAPAAEQAPSAVQPPSPTTAPESPSPGGSAL